MRRNFRINFEKFKKHLREEHFDTFPPIGSHVNENEIMKNQKLKISKIQRVTLVSTSEQKILEQIEKKIKSDLREYLFKVFVAHRIIVRNWKMRFLPKI